MQGAQIRPGHVHLVMPEDASMHRGQVNREDRDDKYDAQEQYQEAILEYRNVLRIDPANERAIRQLGLAHYQLGELGQAFRYLLKAEELAPDNPEVRLKLGTIYFLGGQADEA